MSADNEEIKTYLIPAVNMANLQSELARINKRAVKLNCPPLVLNTVETIIEKKIDPVFLMEYETRTYKCTITGDSPKLNGWLLVAAIEPVKNDTTKVVENIIREVPGSKCPPNFRTTNTECQHCNKIRRRSAVFVLRHENGEYKQVGRSCIADFLGHQSPESMLYKAECLWNADDLMNEASDESWFGGGGRGERVVDIIHFVAIVAIVSRRLGWVPRSKSDQDNHATASIAWDICTMPRDEGIRAFVREHNIVADDKDGELAVEAVKWAAAIDPVMAQSTYLHDLGVCCRQDVVTRRTNGYVASVVSAYQRHMSEQIQASLPKPTKQFVGEEKHRMVIRDLSITHTTPYSSQYGVKTFVRFVDPSGNVLVWRASGDPEWAKIGDTVNIKATIKSHETFNGQPNTVLTRVDPLIEEVAPNAATV